MTNTNRAEEATARRLRNRAEEGTVVLNSGKVQRSPDAQLCFEAADLIETQGREIERYREALQSLLGEANDRASLGQRVSPERIADIIWRGLESQSPTQAQEEPT